MLICLIMAKFSFKNKTAHLLEIIIVPTRTVHIVEVDYNENLLCGFY